MHPYYRALLGRCFATSPVSSAEFAIEPQKNSLEFFKGDFLLVGRFLGLWNAHIHML